MFGKKKKSAEELAAEKAEATKPTPVAEVPIGKNAESKLDIAKYVVDEFQKTYFGIIGGKDLEQVNGEVLEVCLLFAIYGELRLARLEREQK
jgi:hypothetical protein